MPVSCCRAPGVPSALQAYTATRPPGVAQVVARRRGSSRLHEGTDAAGKGRSFVRRGLRQREAGQRHPEQTERDGEHTEPVEQAQTEFAHGQGTPLSWFYRKYGPEVRRKIIFCGGMLYFAGPDVVY